MEYSQWEPIYQQILTDFRISRKRDEEAAELLGELLKANKLVKTVDLANLIENNEIFVFGAGPSLDKDVQDFETTGSKQVIIAADGATSALLEHGVVPDIIVTDLDGFVPDQVSANEQGAMIIIHAHADNITALKEWVPKFNGNLLGTTQSKPDPANKIFNFGGFTDGDRAVFLAAHFNARKITLIAFDFQKIGKHSYKYRSKTKFRKLTWANLLIGMIKEPPIVFKRREKDQVHGD